MLVGECENVAGPRWTSVSSSLFRSSFAVTLNEGQVTQHKMELALLLLPVLSFCNCCSFIARSRQGMILCKL